jgi:hypothetical protein
MHDLASADSRDIPRSACFESKAPTSLSFLLINLPSLLGYSMAHSSQTAMRKARNARLLASGRCLWSQAADE